MILHTSEIGKKIPEICWKWNNHFLGEAEDVTTGDIKELKRLKAM